MRSSADLSSLESVSPLSTSFEKSSNSPVASCRSTSTAPTSMREFLTFRAVANRSRAAAPPSATTFTLPSGRFPTHPTIPISRARAMTFDL